MLGIFWFMALMAAMIHGGDLDGLWVRVYIDYGRDEIVNGRELNWV